MAPCQKTMHAGSANKPRSPVNGRQRAAKTISPLDKETWLRVAEETLTASTSPNIKIISPRSDHSELDFRPVGVHHYTLSPISPIACSNSARYPQPCGFRIQPSFASAVIETLRLNIGY